MATYTVKVLVEYEYDVEADSEEDAESYGWKYEDYYQTGTVESIRVDEHEEDDDDDYSPWDDADGIAEEDE